ncbi:hypothetical protein GCM10017559_56770 [Streptosporangium longisporum]|uniref:Uncharacterized protein n=1 Tax=Streptosporangium longisporum TaxID=46187 RepID=A0ABN3YCZ4_9ACTN
MFSRHLSGGEPGVSPPGNRPGNGVETAWNRRAGRPRPARDRPGIAPGTVRPWFAARTGRCPGAGRYEHRMLINRKYPAFIDITVFSQLSEPGKGAATARTTDPSARMSLRYGTRRGT